MAKPKKMTAMEKVNMVHRLFPLFKFISGKWFIGQKEIKNIDAFLLQGRVGAMFDNAQRMIEFKDTFRLAYGDPTGDWPEMPIVTEAKKIIKEGEDKKLPLIPAFIDHKKLQIIHYLLEPNNEYFIIVYGVGGSGKSTFMNVIRQIFEGDTAAITLKELGEGFRLASAIDKRLIYSTEIDADRITDTNIKKYVSKEPLQVNPKNEKPYDSRFQASFIFNCNTPPSINLSDSGLLRRIVYYRMNTKIPEDQRDPTMNSKIWTNDELMAIVVKALKTDIKHLYDDFEKDTRMGLIERDTVYRYKDENTYQGYRFACQNEGFKPYNRENWEAVRRLLKEWGVIKDKEDSAKKENASSIWKNFEEGSNG